MNIFLGFVAAVICIFSIQVQMSSAMNIAYFDEIKDLPNNPNVLLIDVREAAELKETGSIPTSINIPLGVIDDVFKNTSPDDFKAKYGRTKPGFDDPIIVSCRSGRRSALAYELLEKQGYTNLKNYEGSWLEWAEKNGLN